MCRDLRPCFPRRFFAQRSTLYSSMSFVSRRRPRPHSPSYLLYGVITSSTLIQNLSTALVFSNSTSLPLYQFTCWISQILQLYQFTLPLDFSNSTTLPLYQFTLLDFSNSTTLPLYRSTNSLCWISQILQLYRYMWAIRICVRLLIFQTKQTAV